MSSISNNKLRDSNMELLRIISMFLIVIYHVFAYVLVKYEDQYPLISSFNTLVHIGVIIFFLISGYYGIKPSVIGAFKIWTWMVFFNVLLYVSSYSLGFEPLSVSEIVKLFLPFSHSAPWLWFMKTYIILYMISPLLNMARNKMQPNILSGGGIVLILLGIITFWFGWINVNDDFSDGRNIINASFLYLLGAQFAICPPLKDNKNSKRIYLLSYITLCLVVGCILYFAKGRTLYMAKWLFHPYCSPVLIGMASALFLYFTKVRIKSRAINWMAASILAVYLLHENKFFMTSWHGFFDWYPFIERVFVNSPWWLFLLVLLGGVIGMMIVAILVDKVRMIVLKPVYNLFNKIYEYSVSFIKRRYGSSWS